MALDAKLRIQEARKQRYANFDKKRKVMLEELEEAERADREAKSAEATKKRKFAQEAEQIRDAGRRMVEERQVELQRQQEEAERAEESAQEELDPPPLGAYLSPPSSMFMIHNTCPCFHRRTRYHRPPQVPTGQIPASNNDRCVAHVHVQHVWPCRQGLHRALLETPQKGTAQATQIRDRGRPVQNDSGCPRGGVCVPTRGSWTGRVRDRMDGRVRARCLELGGADAQVEKAARCVGVGVTCARSGWNERRARRRTCCVPCRSRHRHARLFRHPLESSRWLAVFVVPIIICAYSCPLIPLASPTTLTTFKVSCSLVCTSGLLSWPGFRVCCAHANAASREGTLRARDPRTGD
jgi:hypothetical protein